MFFAEHRRDVSVLFTQKGEIYPFLRKREERNLSCVQHTEQGWYSQAQTLLSWCSSQQPGLATFPKQIIRNSNHYLCWSAFAHHNSPFFNYFLHFPVYAVRNLEWHIFSLGTYPRHMPSIFAYAELLLHWKSIPLVCLWIALFSSLVLSSQYGTPCSL